jgi:hypothetical protein
MQVNMRRGSGTYRHDVVSDRRRTRFESINQGGSTTLPVARRCSGNRCASPRLMERKAPADRYLQAGRQRIAEATLAK